MKNVDFSKLSKGTKLWSIQLGNCIINNIVKNDDYCIEVTSVEDKNLESATYTKHGKFDNDDLYQSLFFFNPFTTPIEDQDYLIGHIMSNIKVGDYVKVVGKAESESKGWNSIWLDNMDLCIGGEFVVLEDSLTLGFALTHKPTYLFPYFVLEKVRDSEGYIPYTFKDAEELINLTIKNNSSSRFLTITEVTKEGINNNTISFLELFKDYSFLDNSICGKERS